MSTIKKIRCINVKNGIIKYMPEHLTKDKAYMDKVGLIVQDHIKTESNIVLDITSTDFKDLESDISTKVNDSEETTNEETENKPEVKRRGKRKKTDK